MLPNAGLPPPATDEELLRRALNDGDEVAFARALDSLFAPMLRLAMAHVDSRASAEEIVQETWLAAIRGYARFEGRSSVKTWLFHILRNLARTRGRRDARLRLFSELQSDASADAGPDPLDRVSGSAVDGSARAAMWVRPADPEADLMSRELAAHIERAIATLPPRQCEVITLRDVEGWSADEVCNILGISQTNQRVILHRARDSVRRELQWYLDESDGCGEDDEPDLH